MSRARGPMGPWGPWAPWGCTVPPGRLVSKEKVRSLYGGTTGPGDQTPRKATTDFEIRGSSSRGRGRLIFSFCILLIKIAIKDKETKTKGTRPSLVELQKGPSSSVQCRRRAHLANLRFPFPFCRNPSSNHMAENCHMRSERSLPNFSL